MGAKKTAVITGSNSGIGLGVARALAEQGHNIVLNSFTNSDDDHALAKAVASEFDVEATYISADLSQGEQARFLIEEAAKRFGNVDILVNNAGIQHVAPIESFPPEKWDAILAINLSSVFHTSAVAIGLMKTAGWGRIVNIASAHGLTASPYKSAYVAAKHGVMGLTKTVALEMAENKMIATCNAVCPGYVLTPIIESQIEDQMKVHSMTREEVLDKIMLIRQPTREFATVEQIGGTVAFLCSDTAAQITGTSISVDGGWTAL